ncbi:YceI family protein [Glaciecola sp. XM2]|uniref:YceI family protein n=1 Tax=Glaciecola sp. XM2 TaxID=1914931 RepID=UPI001BDE9AAC|nr:YceI family protein [Glaciecola sp. XM2]MBT1451406.1 YceI family protein [Glaciecola sp. XM2]
MGKFSKRVKSVLMMSLMCAAPFAMADYQLETVSSSVNFLSTKNVNVTESHTFDKFNGTITEDGQLVLVVDLASVNTIIPIRNERMKNMLFDVAQFSQARFTAKLDEALLNLSPGERKIATVEGELSLTGVTEQISFDVVVTGLANGQLSAATVKPTVINAADFNLEGGVEALREIAMLQNISLAVPFSFYVVFNNN